MDILFGKVDLMSWIDEAKLLRVAALAGGLERGNERGGVVQERIDDLYEEVLAAGLPEAVDGAGLETRAVLPCSAQRTAQSGRGT